MNKKILIAAIGGVALGSVLVATAMKTEQKKKAEPYFMTTRMNQGNCIVSHRRSEIKAMIDHEQAVRDSGEELTHEDWNKSCFQTIEDWDAWIEQADPYGGRQTE